MAKMRIRLFILLNLVICTGLFIDATLVTLTYFQTGLVRMTLKALEHMRIDKGGRGGTIVNISSTTALEPDPQFLILPIYCATKGAILHFTNCLAVSFFHS